MAFDNDRTRLKGVFVQTVLVRISYSRTAVTPAPPIPGERAGVRGLKGWQHSLTSMDDCQLLSIVSPEFENWSCDVGRLIPALGGWPKLSPNPKITDCRVVLPEICY